MDPFSRLPPSYLPFADLYSGSMKLIEQTHQFEASTKTSTYHGMPVQVVNNSFPGYNNQSDIVKNNPASLNLLNNYDIESLSLSETASETADFSGTDIPDIPDITTSSVLDEYILGHFGPGPVNDEPSLIPDIPLSQQICLSESKPEIREPAPEGHLNPDYLLTGLPDALPDQQDLRPLTVVNPLNLNQTASDNQTTEAKYSVDDNASIIERRRESNRIYMSKRRKDPVFAERERAYKRDRYQNNPDYAKRKIARRRERCQNTPGLAERQNAYFRRRYQNDPDFAEHQKARFRARYQNDHDFAQRHRERNRLRNRERRIKSNK